LQGVSAFAHADRFARLAMLLETPPPPLHRTPNVKSHN
jgi:hypothetical protein